VRRVDAGVGHDEVLPSTLEGREVLRGFRVERVVRVVVEVLAVVRLGGQVVREDDPFSDTRAGHVLEVAELFLERRDVVNGGSDLPLSGGVRGGGRSGAEL